MNKKLTLLSLCSFIISSSYSMQQPQQPTKSLTLAERKERAKQAYHACKRSYHLKCAEFYKEISKETTVEIKDDAATCEYMSHMSCMKVAQEKFTEGFFEETKEFFAPKK